MGTMSGGCARGLKILVLGASGRLGSTLVPVLRSLGHDVSLNGRRHSMPSGVDLTDRAATARLLNSSNPEIVINLAALTDVDRCESHPQEAYRANVLTVENVAAWVRTAGAGCHLVQISSDQVYNGEGPHAEHQASPSNYYALSKYAGELAALSVGATVLRTNLFGRSLVSTQCSLSDWLALELQARKPIVVFEDVLFSPLCMVTLCEMIERSARARLGGVYNLGSHNGMSKADFAFAFAHELDLPTETLRRGTSDQAAMLKAYRPKDMRMDVSSFERALQVKLPNLRDEIIRCAKDYRESA